MTLGTAHKRLLNKTDTSEVVGGSEKSKIVQKKRLL